jgi:hypothetical protein
MFSGVHFSLLVLQRTRRVFQGPPTAEMVPRAIPGTGASCVTT